MLEITQSDVDPDQEVPHFIQLKFDDEDQAKAEAVINDELKRGYVPLKGRIRPTIDGDRHSIAGEVLDRKKNGHLIYYVVLIKI